VLCFQNGHIASSQPVELDAVVVSLAGMPGVRHAIWNILAFE